ncbi:MAG: 16S rRNA (guanine(527)-N(7))-methyltransferase RsmG [Bacilli bacterium]|nr:16S rRNA (guanine(527)-N(7))-methyltransferase RsmG [Bacilli bacterium]
MTYAELQKACGEFGLVLDDATIAKLQRYAALLQEWNERMNLTSIVDEPSVIEKHFYDSLLCIKGMSFDGRKVADVGSGAGFPGAVIALACPKAQVYLIDATKKKFAFLSCLKEELGIDNLSFIEGRVEDLKQHRESFDVVVSRGFAALRVFAEVGTPLLYVTGTLLAMKGGNVDEEIADAATILNLLSLRARKRLDETLPSGDKRALIYYAKDAHTPKRFPRRWDEIKRTKI